MDDSRVFFKTLRGSVPEVRRQNFAVMPVQKRCVFSSGELIATGNGGDPLAVAFSCSQKDHVHVTGLFVCFCNQVTMRVAPFPPRSGIYPRLAEFPRTPYAIRTSQRPPAAASSRRSKRSRRAPQPVGISSNTPYKSSSQPTRCQLKLTGSKALRKYLRGRKTPRPRSEAAKTMEREMGRGGEIQIYQHYWAKSW